MSLDVGNRLGPVSERVRSRGCGQSPGLTTGLQSSIQPSSV